MPRTAPARTREKYLRDFAARRRKIVALARREGNVAAAREYGITRQAVWQMVEHASKEAERAKRARARAKAKPKPEAAATE